MARIKKIKRDQLVELGEEFDVLTDAEAQESGIAVEADEVLIIAKPAPVQPPSGEGGGADETGTLRNRLHTVNQESAERRIKLREQEASLKALQEENARLKQAEADRKLADTQRKAKELFATYAKDKKYEFVSAEAGDDVAEAAFKDIDWSKPVTVETIGPKVDEIVGKKKYVLKVPALGGTDGGKQSTSGVEDVLDIDLETIAKEFGITDYKPTEGAK